MTKCSLHLKDCQDLGSWKKVYLLWVIFFVSNFLTVQAQEYSFEKLGIEQGLSQNFIFDIEQDFRGFLWFATRDGLNRYDGYSFKIYNHIPSDSNSLSSNVVTTLHQDNQQNLWVGAGALHRYDRLHDRFEKIISTEELQLNQPTLNINALGTDHHGDVWIAVNNAGLYRVETDTTNSEGLFKAYGPYTIEESTIAEDINQSFFHIIPVGKNLWISHGTGLYILKSDHNGKFPPPTTADFQKETFDFDAEEILVNALFLDKESLWISSNQGLIKISELQNEPLKFERFPFPDDISVSPLLLMAKDIVMDQQGTLWMSSYNGIILFNTYEESYQFISNEPQNLESLSLNNTTDLLIDSAGLVWIGTGGLGLNKYNSRQNRFTHFLDKKKTQQIYSIYNIVEDGQGVVWFTNSNHKLGFVNSESDTFGILAISEEKGWHITDLAKGKDGYLWLTNGTDLIKFNPFTLNFTSYHLEGIPNNIQNNNDYVIHADQKGDIWLCNTQRLFRFDPVNESFSTYLLPELNLEHINTLFKDNEDVFWVGSHQGLLRLDIFNNDYRVFHSEPASKDSLNHPRVKAILPDPTQSERYLWISTGGGGFNKFDKQNYSFTSFTHADGLPNNFVYGILHDNQGKLWISTNKGLSRFDPLSKKFENFIEDDGLQSDEFNSRSYYKNNKGELYFGGINGINKFSPQSIIPNQHIPPVVILEMWLMYKTVELDAKESPLQAAITETKDLSLRYDQNNLSFKFAALDFTAPSKNQYFYKLEGFDTDWVKASSDRKASYTNLQPGTYTFKVIGSNNDSVWNTEGATMNIIIAPPLWKTWWAYTAYFLLAAGIVFLFYRYQTDRIRMEEEIKRKEFQNENLAELDQFKSRFFANISHEFRTPISLIIGRVNEIEEANSEEKLSKLQVVLASIKTNAFQVIGLIEQLLDIARLENNKLKINLKTGDLVMFLKILCFSLESSAAEKKLQLIFSAGQPQLFALMDWEIMQKIFQNLIVNAIKFTPRGGQVKVLLESYDINNHQDKSKIQHWVRIQVKDTGIGIAEDQLPHIFDRFYQSELQPDAQKKGFGLGLTMVKELVALQGGSIEVESKPKHGSSFIVHLPYTVPVENLSEEKEKDNMNYQLLSTAKAELTPVSPQKVKSQRKEKQSNDRVLIIEDNAELRAYLTEMLSKEYSVFAAENGSDGLELALTKIPDLIITDLMMPEKDGLELAQDLKANYKTSHIPIIVLTAKADLENKFYSLDIGVDDYLVKPFNSIELRKKIRNLINIRQMLRLKYAQSLSVNTKDLHEEPSLEEKFLKNLNHLIQSNLADEHYNVEKLSAELGMSASQLYRKVKALTGLSTVRLIQHYRLEKAKAYLEKGYNVSEVTYLVGFTSPAYFSQLFKKYTGYMPKSFSKKDEEL